MNFENSLARQFCARTATRVAVLLTTGLLLSCGSDRPSDAVEGTLSVAVALGSFDANRGQQFVPIISIEIDGQKQRIEPTEDATIIGIEGHDFMSMSGQRVVVAGEVSHGVLKAHYIEFLEPPVDDPNQVTEGAVEMVPESSTEPEPLPSPP